MHHRFSWRGIAIAMALAAFAPAASAQTELDCSDEALNRQPSLDAMLAHARACADRNFSGTLQNAASMIERGTHGNPPDWRLAAEIYEELVNRTEPLPYSSFGARRWGGALSLLADNFENGSPETGWSQDFERARGYRSRMEGRLSREPTATPEELAEARRALAESEAKRDLARRRSGRWTGDLLALSKIDRFTVRDSDLGVPRLQADGMTGVMSAVEEIEVDPEDDPRFIIHAEVFLRRPLGSEFAGLCLVLTNGNEPSDKSGRRGGIFYEQFTTGSPYAVTSGPFQGWYEVITRQSYVPIQWAPGTAPTALAYEFRPVTDQRLCPAEM